MNEILQPKSLADIRLQRAQLSLRFGIYALILNGVFWLIFDIIMHHEPYWLLNAILVAVCLFLYWLYHHANYRVTAFFSYSILFGFTFLISSFDIPEKNIPRSQHLFFFAVALYAYIVFYNEKVWLKFCLSFFSILTFIFFQFSDFTIPEASRVPHHIRWYLAVLIHFSACLAITAIIHIIHADLQTKDESAHQLSLAVFENQLELFYQPQVNQMGNVIGAEALIRWNHPTMGILSPDKFIPYAEKSGNIVEIGHWILKTACEQLAVWQKCEATKALTLSINVSAKELQSDDFVGYTLSTLQSYDIDITKLKMEITETAVLHDIESVIETINAITKLGVHFSLDDFGTGYSTLNVLKDLPLNEIKIDKSFVDDIDEHTQNLPITDTLLSLGESLQLACLAEGVETESQWRYLKDKGCNYFQGYFFGKPMQADSFEQFMSMKSNAT